MGERPQHKGGGVKGTGRPATTPGAGGEQGGPPRDKYRELFDASPVGMLLHEGGRFVMCNPAAVSLLRASDAADLLGRDVMEFVPGEHRALVVERYRELHATGGEIPPAEYRIVLRDGSTLDVEMHSRAFLPSPNGALRVLTIIRDISARRRAQAALRESEERFRLLFQQSPTGVAMLEAGGGFGFLHANPSFCAMMGRSEEELLRMSFRDLTPAEDLPGQLQEVQRLLAGEIPSMRLEKRYVRMDGSIFWGRLCAAIVRDEAGRPLYFLAEVEDIDERRRTREALAASEQKYRTLFDLSSDALFLIENEGGMILDANAAASALYGYGHGELVRLRNTDLSAEPEKTRAVTTGTTADTTVVPRRHHRKKDGTVFPVEITGRFFAWEGKPVHIAAIRDVGDRERSEQELVKAQKLDSLALLAGGIAHDFNNLLTGILGNVSLALVHAGEREAVEAKLKDVEGAALRARDLATRLLTFSRGGAPVKRSVPLENAVREAALRASRGSRATLRFDIPADVWPMEADEGQFGHVVQNLTRNAVEAMPQGGELAFTAANRELGEENPLALPPGRYVEIVVSDQGKGIPARDLPRIFDPYFSTRPQGSGLGLAIVHSVVTRHGGRVEVASREGAGSAFTLWLPAASPESKGTGQEAGAAPSPRGRAGRRALVMDDEEMIRKLAREMLEAVEWRAETAPDGKAALDLYRRARVAGDPFDLVILDLTIPGGMGGRAVIDILRREDPAVRAVVSSGYANDPVMARHTEYGFAGVLAKPYRLDDLTALLALLFPPPG
jgi:two-component system, cell cycle sensor histidine kinase and response regulator CckA